MNKITPKNLLTPRHYLSFSQFSLIRYSEQQYIDRYLKGLPQVSNKYVEFGKILADRLKTGTISNDENLEKVVKKIPAYEMKEVEIKVNFDEEILLLGYLDGADKNIDTIYEIKTGQKESMRGWKEQLLFYNLIIYLKFNRLPNNSYLVYVPTIKKDDAIQFTGEVKVMKIDITLKDVLLFSTEVKKVWNKIKEITASYYKNQRLDDAFGD